MNPLLQTHFDTALEHPNGIKKLRELILTLAMQGKLVPQDPKDQPASELLKEIQAEKARLVADGKIKKSEALPALKDEEKPFAIPKGWEWVRLGEVLQKYGAGSTPLGGKSVYTSDGIMFLRSQNVWNDGLYLDDVARIAKSVHEKMKGTKVIGNDILLNITGASIGRSAIFPLNFEEANVSQHVAILRTFTSSIVTYLHKLIISDFFQNLVFKEQVGVSREGLSMAKLSKFPIPLPPLAEQKRIVEKIDQLFLLCDELERYKQSKDTKRKDLHQSVIAQMLEAETHADFQRHFQFLNHHFHVIYSVKENVKELRKAVLQLAVMGKLVPQDPKDQPASELLKEIQAEKARLVAEGKIKKSEALPAVKDDEKPFVIPKGWEWVRLGGCIELISGQHLRPNEYNENQNGIPYFTGPADFGDISPIGNRWTNIRRAIALKGDILLTVKGAGIGKTNIVIQDEAAISRQLMALRVWKLNKQYLGYYLNVMFTKFQELATGIAIPGIGRDDVLHRYFPLPPLAEQKRIVEKVGQLLKLCDALEEGIGKAEEKRGEILEGMVRVS